MNRSVIRWVLAIGVVVSYNSWVLTVFSPRPHALAGYISELAADDQPFSWIFRSGDLIAGALMIVIAVLGLTAETTRLGRWRKGISAAVGITGAATIAAIAYNLPCAPSFDDACYLAQQAHPFSPDIIAHAMTSGIVTVAALASMLMAVFVYRGRARAAVIVVIVLVIMTELLGGLIEEGWRSGQGYVQVVQILLVSVWIGHCALALISDVAPRGCQVTSPLGTAVPNVRAQPVNGSTGSSHDSPAGGEGSEQGEPA